MEKSFMLKGLRFEARRDGVGITLKTLAEASTRRQGGIGHLADVVPNTFPADEMWDTDQIESGASIIQVSLKPELTIGEYSFGTSEALMTLFLNQRFPEFLAPKW